MGSESMPEKLTSKVDHLFAAFAIRRKTESKDKILQLLLEDFLIFCR